MAWLPDVARDAGCERWSNPTSLRKAIPSAHALTNSDRTVFVEYTPNAPQRSAATVRFLAVEPAARRVGLGGRTALELEQRLRPTCRQVYVAVPSRIGIALYFWLRLGYGPLTEVASPSNSIDDATWMTRQLT